MKILKARTIVALSLLAILLFGGLPVCAEDNPKDVTPTSTPIPTFTPIPTPTTDCSNPCNHPGIDDGDIGGVVCCDGKKYSCVWPDNNPIMPPPGSPEYIIIYQCFMEHEDYTIIMVNVRRMGLNVFSQGKSV